MLFGASCSHTVLDNDGKQEGCPGALPSPCPALETRGAPGREEGSVPLPEFREAAVWSLTRSPTLGISNQVLALSASHSVVRGKSLSSLSLLFPIHELHWVDEGIFRTACNCVTVGSSQCVSEQRHEEAGVHANPDATSTAKT